MPNYRVYVLDKDSQLMAAVNLDCAEDDRAMEHAHRLADGYEVELWRLVAQVNIDRTDPSGNDGSLSENNRNKAQAAIPKTNGAQLAIVITKTPWN